MYQQPDQTIWTGRLDSEIDRTALRHFQTVTFGDLSSDIQSNNGVALLGYAIDEGVKLNKGRPGAKEGPDAIRRSFSGLPTMSEISITDYGNVSHEAETLYETQQAFGEYVSKLLKHHSRTFLLGGGHDIAYAQYLGVRAANPGKSIGVINIDAHFDNREAEYSTSGTSFRQMLEQDEQLDYFVLGIQRAGNTQSLFDYADESQTEYVLADELKGRIDPRLRNKIENFIHEHDVILFTICMDVIDSAYAPGVSAPAVLGLMPGVVLELAKRILQSDKVTSLSIAEMNPTYDIDNRTAKLIAHMLTYLIHD
ncbi:MULTISPECIES: formimidoylglutamase [unclassified Staphylococcus]|uniref:formimidoylglutamase n=1 Tax=unclassified Staphylococcus TaxID=91994 RepID=UPI0021D1A413|nr:MULTISPECIES: formimidoylglutamase [unclassified Staphylococcus]UXR69335.1 formimidoylglutamase [Staphylococcus sp. IVB6246]UXR71390.1 formimidoylglutamase [Staphylococcus sp. IVB6240]UXR73668.1 formimidoylglutamase [Staphylococcus sp. IVB6238]UXR75986.1 formimidoylglutamase [Staphylococcus sp. IVB6233]UXR80183.1 formimidoylglutamase [Staphylococcus sp. IVB6218]